MLTPSGMKEISVGCCFLTLLTSFCHMMPWLYAKLFKVFFENSAIMAITPQKLVWDIVGFMNVHHGRVSDIIIITNLSPDLCILLKACLGQHDSTTLFLHCTILFLGEASIKCTVPHNNTRDGICPSKHDKADNPWLQPHSVVSN